MFRLGSATGFLIGKGARKSWVLAWAIFAIGKFVQILSWQGLNVKFQEVVVHSIENCEADVAKQKHSQEIEWTITILLDDAYLPQD